MKENDETDYRVNLDQIQKMIEYPKLFIIEYFDDLKSKIDFEFEKRLTKIQNQNLDKQYKIERKEIRKKKWFKILEIIEKSQIECFKNKLPNDLIKGTNREIAQFNSNQNEILKKIKDKLENYLLSNGKCLALIINYTIRKEYINMVSNMFSIDGNNKKQQMILIMEETLTPNEIGFLKECLKVYPIFDFVSNQYHKSDINFVKIKYLLNKVIAERDNIIYIDGLCGQLTTISISFSQVANVTCINWYQLRLDHMKAFNKLNELRISGSVIGSSCLSCLKDLKCLVLTYCSIKKKLNKNFFIENNIVNLEKLGLSGTNIKSLEENSFESLTSLKVLDLSCCSISLLNASHFTGLTSLEKLSLYSNKNISLESECFSRLGMLNHLYLNKCNIQVIKDGIFTGLVSLRKLELSENQIILFANRCFKSLINLKELKLENCNIGSINQDSFVDLNNLDALDLSANCDIELQDGCFNGLINLKKLNLSSCGLGSKLKENFFSKLGLSSSLIQLSLNSNNIRMIRKNVFFNLNNLELIYCAQNYGMSVEECFFDDLTRLKQLKFTDCRLAHVKCNSLVELYQLEELDLGNNPGVLFEDGCFNGLNSLTHLNLTSCSISLLKTEIFFSLVNLEYLSLISNRIISFEKGFFRCLPKLKALHLESCDLKDLKEDTFAGLDCLETLQLDYNSELNLHLGCLNGLVSLKYLCLPCHKKRIFQNRDYDSLNKDFNDFLYKLDYLNGLRSLKELGFSWCKFSINDSDFENNKSRKFLINKENYFLFI